MTRHRIDPLSAVFGLIAVALGAAVAFGRLDSFDVSADGWLLALVPFVLGLALIPWRREKLQRDGCR
jgi:hypothetical protein